MRQRLEGASLYAALFASGAAALVYQTTWGRMLHRVFGVSDLAIATVLATFFLGMGIGAALGRRADRSRRPARVYAYLEVGVALWALASLWLMPRVHDVYAGLAGGLDFGALTAVRFVLAMLVLLPPTILMGATLPVLIATVARRGIRWEVGATRLYATNTFGAVVGAGLTGLLLIPALGARASVIIAAATSALAGLLVFAVWRGAEEEHPSEQMDDSDDDSEPSVSRRTVRAVALLVAGAGFASLAGEVLWTRVLRMVMQGTTQAFAVMLVNFLTGIALGSIVANRLARRYDARWLFGGSQLLLAVMSFGTMWLGSQMPRLLVLLHGEPRVVPHEWWVILAVSVVLLAPMAVVLGTSVPLAWRLVGGSPEEAARHGGTILAFNTIGGLLGSLAAGFLLIPTLGIEASVVVLATLHALLAAVVMGVTTRARSFAIRLAAIAGPLAVLALLFRLGPSLNVPYLLDAWSDPVRAVVRGPTSEWRGNVRFLEEGRNTTVTVLQYSQGLRLLNDGRPESGFSRGRPGFGPELVTLGALPTVYGDSPDRAMVIGLGAGHSTAVVLGGPYQKVDVVELEGAVVRAARFLYQTVERPFPLDDERATLVVDDARAQLALSEPGRFDAVVSQPSHPWLAGSSALYTREFFQEVSRALSDEGVFALWTNLFRIRPRQVRMILATLLDVFPHVHAYVVEGSSMLFAASSEPLDLDEGYRRAIGDEGLSPFTAPYSLDSLAGLVSKLELDTAGARELASGYPIIEDDRPVLEFELARLPQNSTLGARELESMLAEAPWISAETFAQVPADRRLEVVLARIDWVAQSRKQLVRLADSMESYDLAGPERAIARGALAEARGDVRRALTHYRAALPSAVAKSRLSALMVVERLFHRLTEEAADWDSAPDLEPLLVAALAIRDEAAVRRVLTMAAATGQPTSGELPTYAQAWMDGCDAVLALADEEEPTHEHSAMIALECATEAGRRGLSRRLADRYHRHRRVRAAAEARAGAEARVGNVGKALRHYRRALRANPAQAMAAAGLAEILVDMDQREDARDVIVQALAATKGLPQSTQLLMEQAQRSRLLLPLPPGEDDIGEPSVTSLSPTRGEGEPNGVE
jgi:spermidine synthase